MDSRSSSEEEMIYFYLRRKRKINKRRMWVREIFLHREQLGEYHHLVPQLLNDEEKFYGYFRMNLNSWNKLVLKLKPLIFIGETYFRKSICFEERLTITIRYV